MVTKKKKTALFFAPRGQKVKLFLEKGSWLGVIQKTYSRFQVVTTHGDGWVNISDTEQANNFSFKVERDKEGMLHYAI